MISKNIDSPINLAYADICVGSWAGAKHSRFPKNFPPYFLTGIATLLIGSVPQCNLACKNITSYLLAFASFHGLNNISDQYFHQLTKVS